MRRPVSSLFAAATVLAAVACSDAASPDADVLSDLSAAFTGVPIGFDNTLNTFGDSTGTGSDWLPGDPMRGGPRHRRGPGGPGGPGGPEGPGGDRGMCGGIGHGFHFGFNVRHFINLPASCVFNTASQFIECDTVDRHGLDVVRAIQFRDAAGNVQQAFDTASTDYANVRVSVTGTTTRRGGAVSTVRHASDRTVTGYAAASTRRTINGTSAGSENTTGTTDSGVTFTANRIIGDTVSNVVIPKGDPRTVYPMSGSVIRSMEVSVSRGGDPAVVRSRREVITYDGSATASVVITVNGVTKNCTMPLPRGPLSCS